MPIVLLVGVGCRADGEETESSTTNAVTTSEDVVVLESRVTDTATVSDDEIELPSLSADTRARLHAGTVIVGQRGKGTGNPHGFLRKVKTVSARGDEVVLSTEPAKITDAITRGSARTVTDPMDPYRTYGLASDVGRVKPLAGPNSANRPTYTHEFPGRTIFSASGFEARLDPTVTTCTPKFDTALRVTDAKLETLRFVMDDLLAIDVSVSATARGRVERQVAFPLFKNKIPLPPQAIGPIPVVETVDVSVDLACDFVAEGDVTARVGLHAELPYRFGVDYSNNDWQMIAEADQFTLSPVGPTLAGSGGVTADCRIVPRVALLFYDAIGPYISVTPRFTARANGSFTATTSSANAQGDWSLVGSIRADAGLTGDLNIPGAPRLNNFVNSGIQRAQFNLFTRERSWSGEVRTSEP